MSEGIPIIITIDGPAGAGKSTVARALAQRLGYLYLDSGAMYRCVALKALRLGVDPRDVDSIAGLAERVVIDFRKDHDEDRVFLDGEDVTEEIRQSEVDIPTSLISTIPAVRARLREMQMEIAKHRNVVADGRDMGTRVFPQAGTKVFLTADFRERALRRYRQLKGKGLNPDLEEVMDRLRERDSIDESREEDPLMPAKDAVVVDTTGKTVNEVVDLILGINPELIGNR